MEIKLNDTDRMLASGVLGHDGLFDQQLAPSLNQIATMRRALVDAKIQDTACVAVEEVLAEMAQTTHKLNFVQPRHRRDSLLTAPACARLPFAGAVRRRNHS